MCLLYFLNYKRISTIDISKFLKNPPNKKSYAFSINKIKQINYYITSIEECKSTFQIFRFLWS
jgi:hypothetical protein